MDSVSAGQERVDVNGRGFRTAVDPNKRLMMMITSAVMSGYA